MSHKKSPIRLAVAFSIQRQNIAVTAPRLYVTRSRSKPRPQWPSRPRPKPRQWKYCLETRQCLQTSYQFYCRLYRTTSQIRFVHFRSAASTKRWMWPKSTSK